MHLPATTEGANQKSISFNKKKSLFEQTQTKRKEWINSVKANSIKLNSKAPGV